jgi:hypothetical protein
MKNAGRNNLDLELSRGRLIKGGTYRDLSTVAVIPTRGVIPVKIVQSWMGMATPMNQKFTRIFVEKMEVGHAYNAGVEMILANPVLSQWKYMLTIEEDNAPPPDGLLKLYESIDKFDAVSGLYWTKGDHGQPMIYGDPQSMPKSFIPQVPIPESDQACNGIGMGFALFRIDLFKKVPKPWFRTLQEMVPGQGMAAATQDLYFCQEAAKYGARFAVDNRVRVGHYDVATDTMW